MFQFHSTDLTDVDFQLIASREDPENLFIVGGDVETLTDTFDWERLSDLHGASNGGLS